MISTVHAFTSITSNYLPKARLLAESIKRVDPSVQFHLLLSDDLPQGFNLEDEAFDSVIYAEDLPVDNQKAWLYSHAVVELCTAVKGLGVEYIFDHKGAEKVFYFDPDMVVYSRLDDLQNELETHDFILTPHQVEPEKTVDAIMDNEMASLKYGVFNLGFLGVKNSPEGRKFSRWWADRLLQFCRDDRAQGLFTDQKWVNLAPCFFEGMGVLRSPAYNVATWNISNRHATGEAPYNIEINGEPLGFYHFSGFDSGAQEVMLKKYGSHSPVLFDLRSWYISECEKRGQSDLGALPSKYAAYTDGTAISKEERILYRDRLDLQKAFPDPFMSGPKSYQAWYQANVNDGDNGEKPAKSGYRLYKVIDINPGAGFVEVIGDFAQFFEHSAGTAKGQRWPRKILLKSFAGILRLGVRLLR